MDELAVIERPRELSVTEVKAQVVKVQQLMQDLMQEGTHIGESFPGDKKKNLLKPGADKLCFMFRLRPDYIQDIKELPNGHLEVLTKCQIFHIDSGLKIAEGVGLATTMESKYRWRNASRVCPKCGKETIRVSKNDKGGFYCWTKIGGCGAQFAENDHSITDQVAGKVENTDIADTYNTVIKMSKKRAYVDATITACAASDIFTQDAEDFKDKEEMRNVTENSSSLAKEAGDKRREILNEMNDLLKTQNPDKLDYFSASEIKQESVAARGADIQALRNQLEHIKAELKKKQLAFEPAPFEDDLPAMYSEQEEPAQEENIF
jgi:hypothetical protein